MPNATPFKYAGSINTNTGVLLGAGFDCIPIVSPTEQDVDGFFKSSPISARDMCNFYWNFAGITFSAQAAVPVISNTHDGTTSTNTGSCSISESSLNLQNNSDSQGYDPSERMIAYPDSNSVTTSCQENSGDPFAYTLTISGSVTSVSALRKLVSGQDFLGYGMSLVCDLEVDATNRSTSNVQRSRKKITISSYFETEDTDASYTQVDFGGATFWKKEIDSYTDNSGGGSDPAYIFQNTTTLGSLNAVFFDY